MEIYVNNYNNNKLGVYMCVWVYVCMYIYIYLNWGGIEIMWKEGVFRFEVYLFSIVFVIEKVFS